MSLQSLHNYQKMTIKVRKITQIKNEQTHEIRNLNFSVRDIFGDAAVSVRSGKLLNVGD